MSENQWKPTVTNAPLEFNKYQVKFSNKYIGWEYTFDKFFMKNVSQDIILWKLKVSNNQLFGIDVPSGVIHPGEIIQHNVTHNPGFMIPQNGNQRFSISYVKIKESETCPLTVWMSRLPDGRIDFPIHFPSHIIEPKCRPASKNKEKKTGIKANQQADFDLLKQKFRLEQEKNARTFERNDKLKRA